MSNALMYSIGTKYFERYVFSKMHLSRSADVSSFLKVKRLFEENGGKILLLGAAPQWLEGRLHDYSWLKSTATFEEILAAQPFRIAPAISEGPIPLLLSPKGSRFFGMQHRRSVPSYHTSSSSPPKKFGQGSFSTPLVP